MRSAVRGIALFFCLALCLAVLANVAQAQTYSVLYNLSAPCGGSFAIGGVTLDAAGRIYGTTAYGGLHGGGSVYRLSHEGQGWVCYLLYSFGYQDQDGSNPYAGVAFGPDGLLYGTTTDYGLYGYGTVFRLQPRPNSCAGAMCPWTEETLYNFTGGADGAYPGYGKLTFDQAGNIYGTTYQGGVFKLTPSAGGWTESTIFTYYTILTGVVFDSAGNLYGATAGTVFELSPSGSGWTETTLYNGNNGGGAVTPDGHGNLFGIGGDGPEGGNGIVYELSPVNGGWSLNILQNFGFQYFGSAAPPTFDAQGNLYGPIPSYPSQGFGEIFKLTPSDGQWIYTPYHQFTGQDEGAGPVGAVVFDADGNMYGSSAGVDVGGYSAVWEITP